MCIVHGVLFLSGGFLAGDAVLSVRLWSEWPSGDATQAEKPETANGFRYGWLRLRSSEGHTEAIDRLDIHLISID